MDPQNSQQGDVPTFREVVEKELSRFPKRTQHIVKSRFDVLGKGKGQTLESIGKKYGITRERIRQIIAQVLHDFDSKNSREIEIAIQTLEDLLRHRGGIVEKRRLYEDVAGEDSAEKGAVDFLLTYSDKFTTLDRDPRFKPVFIMSDFDVAAFEKMITAVKEAFEAEGHPKTFDEMYHILAGVSADEMQKSRCRAYLDASAHVIENPFGHWGLIHWPEVNPRATREKAHLVLKYTGKPLHFRDIALFIDKHGLGRPGRATNPQTVHNELIKDPEFVLIGRGMYALREWGKTGGTVREIVKDVLKRAKKPMSREDICEEVLSRVAVKKSTILVNLNNHFTRVGNDKYSL